MQIKILTDASAELSEKTIRENGVTVLNMPVNYDDKEIEQIDAKEFWQLQRSGKHMRTSQPNREKMKEEFLKAKENGYALICIFISSELSGTYETARSAREEVEYEHVYLIDSKKATVGEQMLVLKALDLAKEEGDPVRIVENLESYKNRIRLLAGLDTLKYLAQGGRLSRTVAVIGNVLNLKPVITIDVEGKVRVLAKKIGLSNTFDAMLRLMEKDDIDEEIPLVPLFACDETNANKFSEKLKEKYKNLQVASVVEIGHVIGTHIGPGGFGVVYVAKA